MPSPRKDSAKGDSDARKSDRADIRRPKPSEKKAPSRIADSQTNSRESDASVSSDDGEDIRKTIIIGPPRPMKDHHLEVFKVLILGDAGVGKTALLRRLRGQNFSQDLLSTIGIDFIKKNVEINGIKVQLKIWDTAGHERFESITRFQLRGTQGLMLVYDVSDVKTLHRVGYWLHTIHQDLSDEDDLPVFVLANKVDMQETRTVSAAAGQKVADEHRADCHIETSAMDGTNVELAFYRMAEALIKKHITNKPREVCSSEERLRQEDMAQNDGETVSVKKRKKLSLRRRTSHRITLTEDHERKRKGTCDCS